MKVSKKVEFRLERFLMRSINRKQTEQIFQTFLHKEKSLPVICAKPWHPTKILNFNLGFILDMNDGIACWRMEMQKPAETTVRHSTRWTALGYIRTAGDAQQFQILAHERGTRWEHKVMLEQMDAPTLEATRYGDP